MILLSFAAGFVWVYVYKIICLFRNLLGRGRLMCRIEDFALAVIFAVTTYMFMFKTCGGLVRGYNYILLVLGVISACVLFSKVETALMVRRARKRKAEENENKAGS